jgi:hypothetical protein
MSPLAREQLSQSRVEPPIPEVHGAELLLDPIVHADYFTSPAPLHIQD